MLYVGSFYCFKEKEQASIRFLYLAEADRPEEAVEIFRSGIKTMARNHDIGTSGQIYMDAAIGINRLPRGGVMALLQEIDLNDAGSMISCALPGNDDGIESFNWSADSQESKDEPAEYGIAPFLTLPKSGKPRPQSRKPKCVVYQFGEKQEE